VTADQYGPKPERKHRTEEIGIIVSRPYAPAGAKMESEGEVKAMADHTSIHVRATTRVSPYDSAC